MKAERLLAHYDRIADAPDAIPRLRRFILDLAVRGKLVPQDPNDEPVAAALARRRVPCSRSGPFDLPSQWAWVRAGGVAQARLGKMLDRSKNRGTPWKYLRNVNVRWFDFDLSNVLRMPFEDFELPEFELRPGDVLICEGGEPGRAAVWDGRERGIYFQKAIHRVRFSDPVRPHYFAEALRASADDGRLAEYFTGTGIKHFTGKGLDAYLFPLPPLAEQHRIVAKVDELKALCDRLEAARAECDATRHRLTAASLARLNTPDPDPETFAADARFALDKFDALAARPDQIKQLRQAIINLAVRGKLVPQDPNGAQDQTIDDASNPIAAVLPQGWRWLELGALLSEETLNGYSRRPDDAADGTPIFRISAGTVRKDGIVAEEEFKRISNVDEATKQKFQLQAGDLLACRFNGNKGSVGRLAIFRNYLGLAPIFPDKLIRVRINGSLAIPEYVRAAGDSNIVRAAVDELCATTVGNWGISASNLKKVVVPTPPLAEQRRIVAKVDELMALCDRLEGALAAASDTRRRLLDALLVEALTSAVPELEAAQ